MRWRIGWCLLAASCASMQPAARDSHPSIASAVPPDATKALLLDKPWARAATYSRVAAKLGFTKQYTAALATIRRAVAFDLADPAQVRSHGFDDQGGLAAFTLPGEEKPIFVIGVADAELAAQTLDRMFGGKRAAEQPVFEPRPAPSGDSVMVARRPRDGPRGAYLLHGGFLYLRIPLAGDPASDLMHIAALAPGQGLTPAQDALATASAVVFLAGVPSSQTWLPGVRLEGGLVLGLDASPDRLALRVHGRRSDPDTGDAQAAPPPRVDLAAGLPAGAALWLQVSCAPAFLWSGLSKNVPERQQLAAGLQTMFGEDAGREVRSSLTGNFALAIYPSAAMVTGGMPRDSPGLVLAAELAEGRASAVEAILDRGAESLSRNKPATVQRRVANGTPLWRIPAGAIVAIQGQRLLAVFPTRPGGTLADTRRASASPPRWPPEATPEELGALSEVLTSRRSPLREQLRRMHSEAVPAAPTAILRASGAILDLRALLGSVISNPPGDFLQLIPALLQQVRFDWRLGRDTVDSELRLDFPEKVVATREAPAVVEGTALRARLKESRRLADEHPEVPTYHEWLAMQLLDAAAATAAREDARRATSFAPGNLMTYLLLGNVLEHDLLGRRWRVGFDADGAEMALRKVEELDTDNYGARVGLALLFERDRGGQRDTARLPEAVEEIRRIREAWKREDLNGKPDDRLLEAEFFAGLWSEVLADAPRLSAGTTRDGYALAARTILGSAEAAVKDSERLGAAATRATALGQAMRFLEITRRYPDAVALGRAAAGAVPAPPLARRAELDAKVRRVETPRSPPSDPAAVVEQAAVAAYDPRERPADLRRFLADDPPFPDEAVRAALLAITTERRAELLATDLSVANTRDYFHSLSEFRVQGDRDSGWRVELISDSVTELWWLVEDRGGPKVFCRASCTGPLGGRALALSDAGKPEAARRVLDWARDALRKEDREAHATLFASIWNGDGDRTQLAAAVAASGATRNAHAIPILAAAVKSAVPPLRDRVQVALALAQVAAKDPVQALRTLEGVDPTAVPEARRVRVTALLDLERFDEAQRAVDEWLRVAPDDPDALWKAFEVGSALDDLPRIEGPARKLIAAKNRAPDAANALAWAKYCHGRLDGDAVALAESTVKSGSAAAINTLAVLYAETGRLEKARAAVLASIDANDAFAEDGTIGFADRYALARIWEGYGLEDLALVEYRELAVTKEKPPHDRQCIAASARRRMSGLKVVQ